MSLITTKWWSGYFVSVERAKERTCGFIRPCAERYMSSKIFKKHHKRAKSLCFRLTENIERTIAEWGVTMGGMQCCQPHDNFLEKRIKMGQLGNHTGRGLLSFQKLEGSRVGYWGLCREKYTALVGKLPCDAFRVIVLSGWGKRSPVVGTKRICGYIVTFVGTN